MTRRRKILWWALAAFALVVAGCVAWWLVRRPELAGGEEYRFAKLKTVAAYIAMTEKPDAVRVLFADGESEAWRGPFERAGLECRGASQAAAERFDVVVAAGEKTRREWKALAGRLAPGGVIAWNLDVRGMKASAFKRALEDFPCPQAHVWMPGENDWLLTGRMEPGRVKLDVALEVFAREQSFEDLADAECETLSSLFASYVGCREDVMPAFDGDLDAVVRPEFFLTQEIPVADWFERGDVDEDIYESIGREIRSVQVVRRLVVEGNMFARKRDGIEAAEEKWSSAARRNPHDPMLLDRLYRLALNARVFMKVGNFKGAARCLETMIVIRPTDAAAIAQYADCLKLLGKRELAAEVRSRADAILRRSDEAFAAQAAKTEVEKDPAEAGERKTEK